MKKKETITEIIRRIVKEESSNNILKWTQNKVQRILDDIINKHPEFNQRRIKKTQDGFYYTFNLNDPKFNLNKDDFTTKLSKHGDQVQIMKTFVNDLNTEIKSLNLPQNIRFGFDMTAGSKPYVEMRIFVRN